MAISYRYLYQSQLEESWAFQDYIQGRLWQEGIILGNFQTRAAQLEHGENALGLEIKHDKEFARTGNFWIEVAEKSDPGNLQYVTSGIDREDGSWLFGIGNYREFFLFSKRALREYRSTSGVKIRENGLRTSMGFLLSRKDAAALIERAFYWPEGRGGWSRRQPGEEG